MCSLRDRPVFIVVVNDTRLVDARGGTAVTCCTPRVLNAPSTGGVPVFQCRDVAPTRSPSEVPSDRRRYDASFSSRSLARSISRLWTGRRPQRSLTVLPLAHVNFSNPHHPSQRIQRKSGRSSVIKSRVSVPEKTRRREFMRLVRTHLRVSRRYLRYQTGRQP